MKSILYATVAALAFSCGRVMAQESTKAASGSGVTEYKAGPIGFSITSNVGQDGKVKKTPYLGVVTSPLSPQLQAQTNLPEGMGLSVDAVAKDSPAEISGLKRYDVLKKFNDQMLCAQEQLSVLVKAAGKGTKVTLVVLRGGKEQNVDVTLGEHDAPDVSRAQFSMNGTPGVLVQVQDLDKMLQQGGFDKVLPQILRYGSEANTENKRSAGIQDNYDKSRNRYEARRKELETKIENEIKNDRDAPKTGEGTASTSAQIFSIYPDANAQSMVSVTDADGTVEINQSNGMRTVKIKDSTGQDIYTGDLNNEADHNAVPEKYRTKVKDVAGKIKISVSPKIKNGTVRKIEKIEVSPATDGTER